MSVTASSLPGTKHKVIGLVSGGKDSCFNLMHCIANGHEVIALGTLQPAPGIDELDSHLYQSVGTHLLPLIAESMGYPLYTRVIKGKAVQRGPEYGSRLKGGEGSGSVGDETEDLYLLLKDIMSHHPDATALASGAILSTYQRLRIEHVCTRLGLVSLSYLWQQEQLPLVDRMLGCGVRAVLVKVAGVGLGVEVVGRELGEIRGLLGRLESQYGAHPAGEGGEYETLTLDIPLFSHRLILTKTRTIVTDPEPYPVAYLKVEEAKLEEKVGWVKPGIGELREMLGLGHGLGMEGLEGLEGLDEESREVLERVGRREAKSPPVGNMGEVGEAVGDEEFEGDGDQGAGDGFVEGDDEEVRFGRRGRWFAVSVSVRVRNGEGIGDEVKRGFDAISASLTSQNLSLPLQATHITLLLPQMSLFAEANQTYTKYFGTSPPSRATISIPLPRDIGVKLEVLGFDDSEVSSRGGNGQALDEGEVGGTEDQGTGVRLGNRSALHVQGLSYWAPANIGPYSQAVVVNSRVHIAGQIPLHPSSLTLPMPPHPPQSPYPHQAILALQHILRILQILRSKNSTGGGWEGWGESCIAWLADSPYSEGKGTGGGGGEGEEIVRRAWKVWSGDNGFEKAPVVFLRASELPRGALVEFQVGVNTGRRPDWCEYGLKDKDNRVGDGDNQEEEDEEDEEIQPVFERGGGEGVWWECVEAVSRTGRKYGFRAAIFFSNLEARPDGGELDQLLSRAVSIKAYHLASIPSPSVREAIERLVRDGSCLTLIPVLGICGRSGRSGKVVLEVFG